MAELKQCLEAQSPGPIVPGCNEILKLILKQILLFGLSRNVERGH